MSRERSESFGTSDEAMPKGELRYPSGLRIDPKLGSSSHDLMSPSNLNAMYKGTGDSKDGLLLFVPSFQSVEMARDAKSRTPSRVPSKNASPIVSGRSTPRSGHLCGHLSVRSTSPTDNDTLNTSPRALLMRNKMRDLLLEESVNQPRRPIVLETEDSLELSDCKPIPLEHLPMLVENAEESSESFKR